MEKIPFNRWAPLKERHEIGDQYRKRFHSLIESAKMVQEHPFVRSFSFIPRARPSGAGADSALSGLSPPVVRL